MLLIAGVATIGMVAISHRATHHPIAKPSNKAPRVAPAAAQARSAALDLARQPAAHYVGNLTTADGDELPVDLTVTNTGTTGGNVGSGADRVNLLVIGGKTFFSANAAFWKSAGATSTKAARYASQWVRIEGGYIGIDPEERLAPSTLSTELIKAVDAGKTTAAPAFKNGVSARPITVPEGTVYVSTEAPYRVVHIDTETTQDPGGGLTQAGYAPDSSFDLDVSYLSESAARALFTSLKGSVARLVDAIDSQVDFDLDGSVVLAPCTSSRCTATARISNKLRGSGSYVRTDEPIIVEVVIAFTLDNRPIRACTDVVTMVPNGKGTTACGVSYRLPADGSRHTIRAGISGFAKALSKADVAHMSADLVTEMTNWRVRQAGSSGLPDASAHNGKYQFRPPATYDPNAGGLTLTGVGYLDAAGNSWTEADAKGLASTEGFTHEWRVTLSSQGRAAWPDATTDALNITPRGEIAH